MKRKRKDPLINFGDERRLVRHWATVYNIKEVWVAQSATVLFTSCYTIQAMVR